MVALCIIHHVHGGPLFSPIIIKTQVHIQYIQYGSIIQLQVNQLDIVSLPASVTGPRARRPAGCCVPSYCPPFATPPPNHCWGKITQCCTASGERTSLQKVIKVNTATRFIPVTKQPDGQTKKHVLCRVVARKPSIKNYPPFHSPFIDRCDHKLGQEIPDRINFQTDENKKFQINTKLAGQTVIIKIN